MIIDCISDLHGHYPKLEGGDLLIVAGDLTASDTRKQYDEFDNWLSHQLYKKKIFIAGNHDNLLIKEKSRKYMEGPTGNLIEKFEYLCDSGIEFDGLKIWGSPWSLWFHGVNPSCQAFMGSESMLEKKWNLIPRNTDILITHTPPFNFLDRTVDGGMVGSTSLLDWVGKWKPRLHVFGHIHESYGQEHSFFGRRNFGNKYGVTMINASHVNECYEPVNKPIRVIL